MALIIRPNFLLVCLVYDVSLKIKVNIKHLCVKCPPLTVEGGSIIIRLVLFVFTQYAIKGNERNKNSFLMQLKTNVAN